MVRWSAGVLLGLAVAVAPSAQARITRLEILRTEPAFAGQSFGSAGAFDHVTARVDGELDPPDPPTRSSRTSTCAPRDARGMVRVHAPTSRSSSRPTGARQRHAALRGQQPRQQVRARHFQRRRAAGLAERNGLSSPGDGWLMRQGYTLVWWGWEMDVLPGLQPHPDAADRRAPAGRQADHRSRPQRDHHPRADTTTCPSAAASKSTPYAAGQLRQLPHRQPRQHDAPADGFLPTLTVRAREQDRRARRSPMPTGASASAAPASAGRRPTPSISAIQAGFQPGRLYELIYRAKDPLVLGLGFAATRDLGAFLTRSPQPTRPAPPTRSSRPDQRAIIDGLIAKRAHDPQLPRPRLQRGRSGQPGLRWRLPAYRRRPDAAQRPLRPAGSRLGRADRPYLSRLRFPLHLRRARPTR